ncbi:MAG: hypothetical protein GX803_05320 [Lentisphaerae bacterium]|jgi:hypothetical protein|nr:hypothetical protein [Lentisphaerota bacterium]
MMTLFKLIEGLWPVTYLTGLFVTIAYFRKHGKPVFVLLLIYFALGVYSHTLARHVDRFFMSRSAAEISQAQLDKYEAYQKETEDLYLKHFGTAPGHTATAVGRIQFPLGQILLVLILFLLGRQMKQKTPNQALHGTADSRANASASVP